MRRTLILAAAFALAGATHASAADEVSHDVNLTAHVPSLCSFAGASGAGLTDVGESSSTFIVPIDGTLGMVAAETEATLTFAVASCNATSAIELKRNGFRHLDHASQIGLPPTVKNEIEYQALVTWGGGGAPLVQLMPGVNQDDDPNLAPRNAPLSLTIIVAQGEDALVAGDYSDTLTLTVNPN